MTKAALVTGAGSGIGRALCIELSARGYFVAVVDIDDQDAQETLELVQAAGGSGKTIQCDVTKESEVAAVVDTAGKAFPWPDLVFSNAGVTLGKPATDYTRADLEWLFSVNVFGMWDVACRFAQKAMARDKNTQIVVTGSEHSLGFAHGGMAAYTASKHATLGFANVMQAEWQETPASMSVLCPGLSQSRLWDGERHREGGGEGDAMAQAVMGAGMPAEEVARLAIEGAERGDFLILTHSHVRDYARARLTEVEQAYDALMESNPSEKNYEVMAVAGELIAAQHGDGQDGKGQH